MSYREWRFAVVCAANFINNQLVLINGYTLRKVFSSHVLLARAPASLSSASQRIIKRFVTLSAQRLCKVLVFRYIAAELMVFPLIPINIVRARPYALHRLHNFIISKTAQRTN